MIWEFFYGLCDLGLIFPSVFMAVFRRLIAPVLPLFCDEEGWLPDWLCWFQTPDYSCDGEEGHKKRWPSFALYRLSIDVISAARLLDQKI